MGSLIQKKQNQNVIAYWTVNKAIQFVPASRFARQTGREREDILREREGHNQ